jgi:spore germination protein YaaH
MAAVVPRFLKAAKRAGSAAWVTVVNDVRSGGEVRLKDAEAIAGLISDPLRRLDHARALARKAAQDGFAGLHLDYEGIEPRYAEDFQQLVVELRDALASEGLGLNVVVEPQRTPLPAPGSVALTVMGYNQHGPHGIAGPRATPLFVAAAAARGRGDVNASPTLALALGGFLWTSTGPARAVDWASAQAAAAERGSAQRGLFTRVPNVRQADGGELWYEDPESLAAKWRAAHAAGFRSLMLWRLGGNDERLYEWLAGLRNRTY